jgi:hypothetical protein
MCSAISPSFSLSHTQEKVHNTTFYLGRTINEVLNLQTFYSLLCMKTLFPEYHMIKHVLWSWARHHSYSRLIPFYDETSLYTNGKLTMYIIDNWILKYSWLVFTANKIIKLVCKQAQQIKNTHTNRWTQLCTSILPVSICKSTRLTITRTDIKTHPVILFSMTQTLCH